MNNYLFLNTNYVIVRKKQPDDFENDINGYIVKRAGFNSPQVFIPLEDITNELLYTIFSFSPKDMFGYEIERYKDEVVPEILQTIRIIIPDIYNKFILKYPQYDIVPNYIGKKSLYIFFKTKYIFWI